MTLKLAIAGAAGRMGLELARIIHASKDCLLAGALEAPHSAAIGADYGSLIGVKNLGLLISADAEKVCAGVDGIIDFTIPAATLSLLQHTRGRIHVIGTTGIDAAGEREIAKAAKSATIVKSGNFSLGINMLAALVKRTAAALGQEFDIEILEMHHRMKIDAPSGTALLLGQAAADGRAVDLEEHAVRSRDGHTGARNSGDIGFATLRGGSVVGEHTVIFASAGERLELRHVAESRTLFARGAVKAAIWAQGRAPGLYSMSDVLGLD